MTAPSLVVENAQVFAPEEGIEPLRTARARSRPTPRGYPSRRLGALAPWVHVAVVERSTIFADISQAVAALG